MTSSLPQAFLDLCRRQAFVVAIVVLVAMLSVANWVVDPGQAQRWLRRLLTLPLIWFVPTLWYAWRASTGGPDDERDAATRRYYLAALAMGVLAVGIVQATGFGLQLWVRLGGHGGDLSGPRRILGLAQGAAFIVTGNALPKILTPLTVLPLHLSERVTSARRFVGTAMVLEGLALGFAFLFLPLAPARAFARWAIVLLVATIAGAIVWMNAAPARRTP